MADNCICLVTTTISFLFIVSVTAMSGLGCFRSHENGDEVDSDASGGGSGIQDGGFPDSGGGETSASGGSAGTEDQSGLDGGAKSGGSGGSDPKDANSADKIPGTTGPDSSGGSGGSGHSDGSGGTGSAAGDAGTTPDRGTAGTGGYSGGCGSDEIPPAGTNTMTGHVESYTGARIGDLTIRAYDNGTVTEVYDEGVTDAEGNFTLKNLPDGEVCVMTVGDYDNMDPPRIDTYTYNVPSDAQDRMIVSSDMAIEGLFHNLLGTEPNRETGSVSGAVYYVEADGTEKIVGCATVSMSVPGTVCYFDGPLPNPDRQVTDPSEDGGRGRFLLTLVEPGPVTVTATLPNGMKGETCLYVFTAAEATGGEFSRSITKVYIEGTGNPNPDCSL